MDEELIFKRFGILFPQEILLHLAKMIARKSIDEEYSATKS